MTYNYHMLTNVLVKKYSLVVVPKLRSNPYRFVVGHLPSIRVHGRHDVDARSVYQVDHILVTLLVFLTHHLHQM